MSVLQKYGQHEYIVTNGVKLHYVTQGEGPLLLLLHGFPEFWYSWRYQMQEFSKDFKVVALDLRGYNESDKPKNKLSYVMAEFVKDIEGVIKELGYERCTLVGHDWGGAIAWNFAYDYPEMLEQLIVLNLPHPAKFAQGFRTLKQLLRSFYIFLFLLPWLPEQLLRYANYKAIEKIFRDLPFNKNAFTKEDIEVYKEALAKPGALTAMLNYYRNISHQRMLGLNWNILEVPTLMIWGENDTGLGVELTYETQKYVRDFRIKYIPNSNHCVHQEQPQLVNQYMREFLEQYSSHCQNSVSVR